MEATLPVVKTTGKAIEGFFKHSTNIGDSQHRRRLDLGDAPPPHLPHRRT